MLEAKSITRRFGRTLALDNVDFFACAGEIHALLGENGAGKTTLMNVFTGAIRPDAGSVTLDGAPLPLGSPEAALRAGIAAATATMRALIRTHASKVSGSPGFTP